MSIITSNETKRKPTAISLNIYFIYRKLLQTFRKSICPVKEFFLVNVFIGVFCFITTRFITVISQNTTHFWIFFHYTVNLLLLLSCLLPNKTSPKLCKCKSYFLLQMLQPVILICRFHMAIFTGAAWKFSLVFWSYVLELAVVLHLIFHLQV